jgi:TetR/AcrR family transcriptional regulator
MCASPAEDLSQRGDTAERILLAAADLFAQRGYEAVSMNDIARQAGVSKANVFHHFSNKNELYLTVVRRACTHSQERLTGLGRPQGTLAERFAVFARSMLGDMLAEAQVSRIILRELLLDGEQRGPELAERVFGDNFSRLVAILREGQKQGTLRHDLDPAMVATLLIGANVFFFEARDVLRHFRDVSFADQPEQYSRMLVDILLKGVLASPEQTTQNKTTP